MITMLWFLVLGQHLPLPTQLGLVQGFAIGVVPMILAAPVAGARGGVLAGLVAVDACLWLGVALFFGVWLIGQAGYFG